MCFDSPLHNEEIDSISKASLHLNIYFYLLPVAHHSAPPSFFTSFSLCMDMLLHALKKRSKRSKLERKISIFIPFTFLNISFLLLSEIQIGHVNSVDI